MKSISPNICHQRAPIPKQDKPSTRLKVHLPSPVHKQPSVPTKPSLSTSALGLFRHHSSAIREAVSIVYRLANRTVDDTPDQEDSFTVPLTRDEYSIFLRTIGTDGYRYKRVAWSYSNRRSELTIEMPGFWHEDTCGQFSGTVSIRGNGKIDSDKTLTVHEKMMLRILDGKAGEVKLAKLRPDGTGVITGSFHTFHADSCFFSKNHVEAYGKPYPPFVIENAVSQSLAKLHWRLIEWISDGQGRVSYALGFYCPKFDHERYGRDRLPPVRLVAYKKGKRDPDTGMYEVLRCECRWIVDRNGVKYDGTHRISMRHFLYIADMASRARNNPRVVRPSNGLLRETVEIPFEEYHDVLAEAITRRYPEKPHASPAGIKPQFGQFTFSVDLHSDSGGSDKQSSPENSMLQSEPGNRSDFLQRAILADEKNVQEPDVEKDESGRSLDYDADVDVDVDQYGNDDDEGGDEDAGNQYSELGASTHLNHVSGEDEGIEELVDEDQGIVHDEDEDGGIDTYDASSQLSKEQMDAWIASRQRALAGIPRAYLDDPEYDFEEDLREDSKFDYPRV
ncbi:hypothetical protein BJ508DRAFT_313955 [Ascobolus immersus RN42]|uniref:Uncharacterized protein n=1 Tax=Ascobolus immersus RN42 TaxID=1160509 RepID=A0A3N4HMF4_ASCIM|nr:hypothetical protein BJ508DRAFT_313955 [Ascobolus immersus RN42]